MLALVAAVQPAAGPPGPGQFQYTDSVSLTASDTQTGRYYFAVSYHQHRQIWIGSDGSGRIVEANTDPTFPSRRDRKNWIAAGRPLLRVAPWRQKFGPHGLSAGPADERKLPANPAELARLIDSRRIEGGPPGRAEDFVRGGDLLRETDAPPALRSALFEVASHIPGVRVLGTVTDRVGRRGIDIAYASRVPRGRLAGQAARDEMIFDPATSALLDEQTVIVNPKTHRSTVTSWTVYLSSGVVDSISATPAGMAGR